jgi:hypothetical protein
MRSMVATRRRLESRLGASCPRARHPMGMIPSICPSNSIRLRTCQIGRLLDSVRIVPACALAAFG